MDSEEVPSSQPVYQPNLHSTYPTARTATSQPARSGYHAHNFSYMNTHHTNTRLASSYGIPGYQQIQHNITPAQYQSMYNPYDPMTQSLPRAPIPPIPAGHAPQMLQSLPTPAYLPTHSNPVRDEMGISQRDDFISLIREIATELSKDPKVVDELKFILSDKFTREEIDNLTDVGSILNKMMEKQLLSENKVCYLEDYLKISYESLSKRLIQFRQSSDRPKKPAIAPVAIPDEHQKPIPHKMPFLRPPVESGVYSYSMDKRPHGVCAIFNNTNFTTDILGKRKGSEIDRDRLMNMFQHLQYNVEVHNDLTADDMCTTMDEISQRNHRDFDSFVCCILTHGADNDALYGSDGKEINLRKVMSLFYGKNARTLFGKPKIFFIQACRGDLEDMGFTSTSIGADSESGDKVHFDSSDLPDTADFLIAFPTSSGFVSWRSHNEGTWYIKALCDQLALCHNQHDLMTILTMVNGKVAQRRTSEGHKQMPAPVTHLRKLVYIRT